MEDIVWDGQPVKRACSSCGSSSWTEIKAWMEDMVIYDHCSQCEVPVQTDGVPDVYMPRAGMTFQALCDEMGKPIEIQSKRHKQKVMNELGLRECPERLPEKTWIDGSRDYRKKNFEQARPKIREAYKQYLDNARRRNG